MADKLGADEPPGGTALQRLQAGIEEIQRKHVEDLLESMYEVHMEAITTSLSDEWPNVDDITEAEALAPFESAKPSGFGPRVSPLREFVRFLSEALPVLPGLDPEVVDSDLNALWNELERYSMHDVRCVNMGDDTWRLLWTCNKTRWVTDIEVRGDGLYCADYQVKRWRDLVSGAAGGGLGREIVG